MGDLVVESAAILAMIAAADDPALAVVAILDNLEKELSSPVVCCAACGCLCRASEHCPVCQPEAWPDGYPT